jgi:hypothetical protein
VFIELNTPYQRQRESLSNESNHKIRNRLCSITIGASGGRHRVTEYTVGGGRRSRAVHNIHHEKPLYTI